MHALGDATQLLAERHLFGAQLGEFSRGRETFGFALLQDDASLADRAVDRVEHGGQVGHDAVGDIHLTSTLDSATRRLLGCLTIRLEL